MTSPHLLVGLILVVCEAHGELLVKGGHEVLQAAGDGVAAGLQGELLQAGGEGRWGACLQLGELREERR